jgi:cytochrome c biogenesis protein CcmG, thiol:disulfide interchange protein DsbE
VDPELSEGSPLRTGEPEAQAPSRDARRRGPLRFVAPALGLATAVALIALLVYGVIARAPDTDIDDSLAGGRAVPAPSYRLAVLRRGSLGRRLQAKVAPALGDGRVSPSELRGTPYVLNVWASWCVPCRDEAPELTRAWRRERPRGVLFVGLDMQDSAEDARAFMDHYGVDYLNIRDPTNETPHRYGATGVPETYFISGRGEIVGHVIGVVSPAQLRAGIAAAVAGRPEAARQGGEQRPTR